MKSKGTSLISQLLLSSRRKKEHGKDGTVNKFRKIPKGFGTGEIINEIAFRNLSQYKNETQISVLIHILRKQTIFYIFKLSSSKQVPKHTIYALCHLLYNYHKHCI